MGRAMLARLALALLLLALLLPAQIYSSDNTTDATVTNSTQTLPVSSPTNTTTATDAALKSTASLLVILFSLLHLYC